MENQFTLFDIDSLMDFIGLTERVEHEGYLNDLECMDFRREDQARDAIRKWLLPVFENWQGRSEIGRNRVKVSLRVIISRWGFLPCGPDLPGIDNEAPPFRPIVETISLQRQFYLWLWDELFHEPFSPFSETDCFQERTDQSFVNAPNDPEEWGTPRFRDLSHWDAMIRTDYL